MGREKDPFQRHGHSQNRGKREYEDEYNLYEDDYDLYDDEFELDNEPDLYENGSRVPRRRSATPLPPFPPTPRNPYSRTSRARRISQSRTPKRPTRPTPTSRPKRLTYLPDEPQPPSRRSTESYQRTPQQTRHIDDVPRRPSSARLISSEPRKRKVWPIFLVGCAAGAVSLVLAVAIAVLIGIHYLPISGPAGTGNKAAGISDKPDIQTVPLSALSQLQVCDIGGNISLGIDPNQNATSATITTTKIAQTTDQNDATQTFRQIAVSVNSQPLQSLTCPKSQANNAPNPTPTSTPTEANNTTLSVNVTFTPNQSGQTVPMVDVDIKLPKSAVQVPDPTNTAIAVEVPHGNIDVNGLSGIMLLTGNDGDITVQGGAIVDGSLLTTLSNITLKDILYEKKVSQYNSLPYVHYILHNAHQIDVTLPENTNIILDANTNVGQITSEFPIQIHSNGKNGPACYYGSLNGTPSNTSNSSADHCPAVNNPAAPVLTLNVSTGNIHIHKAKIPQNIS